MLGACAANVAMPERASAVVPGAFGGESWAGIASLGLAPNSQCLTDEFTAARANRFPLGELLVDAVLLFGYPLRTPGPLG